MYYRWRLHTKSRRACMMQVFFTLTEVKCFKYSASCSGILFTKSTVKKMFCSIKKKLFSCISSSPQFLLLSLPSLPPSLLVLSLSLISDPFFMHYSITLNSHLQNISSSHLSQTHFVLFSPSFSHFAPLLPALALLQCIMTLFLYFSPSPPLLSLCSLLWLHHPILRVSFTLIFTPHLDCHSVYITLSVCTAVIVPFKCLFKTYRVIWFLMLTLFFYNTNVSQCN